MVATAVVVVVMGFVEEMLTTATGAEVVGAAVIDAAGCWTGIVAGVAGVVAVPDVLVQPAARTITIHMIRREKRVIFLMVSL